MSGRVSVSADLVQRTDRQEQWSFALLFFSADTRCQQRPESPQSTDFTGIHRKALLFLDYGFSETRSLRLYSAYVLVKLRDVMPTVRVELM